MAEDELPGGASAGDKQPDSDHRGAERNGPAHADAVGNPPHGEATDRGANPGERIGQRRQFARIAEVFRDLPQRDDRDLGGAV